MDLKSFTQAIQQIADEKGISRERIIETIEMALAAAYKRDYGKKGQIVRATLHPETGKLTFRQIKIVVDDTMIKSEEEVLAEEEERATTTAGSSERSEHNAGEIKKEEMREKRGGRRSSSFDFDNEDDSGDILEAKKVRFNPEKHIMIEEACAIKEDVKPGEMLEFPLEAQDEYGRIAAQTAKQVILQRIREAERESVYDEFKNKEGELISGIVQRVEGRNVFVDIGRSVAVLPSEEQLPRERYRIGERVKALVMIVEKNAKGPGVFLSRSHPRLLKKLFELEVPEISSGTVEIKAVAREAGFRSKVAVVSHEDGVDPVGSLVGQKGIRVSTVINELAGEKIDIIEWSENLEEFIAHALSPAKVLRVELQDGRREAHVLVPDDQLSLAIGKGGQNVRLAVKLTGWKIDVQSEKVTSKENVAEVEEGVPEEDQLTSSPEETTNQNESENNDSDNKKEEN